jgi:hypothetical protein
VSVVKFRTVDRTVFSAEGLTAGVELQNSRLFRELLIFRGRNWYPRKSDVTFGYPRFNSEQYSDGIGAQFRAG